MTTELTERVGHLESRVIVLGTQVEALRQELREARSAPAAETQAQEPTAARPAPPVAREPARPGSWDPERMWPPATPVASAPVAPAPAIAPVPVAAPISTSPTPPEVSQDTAPPGRWSPAPSRVGPTLAERLERLDLVGARGLALAGGVVTLLGIVFFFVLAANRGWIGPQARVTMGALVSVLALGAGMVVRRRFGDVYAALASAGAGIAGGYMTLLAATVIYDMVSEPVGLAVAAGIAVAGTAVAWSWSSELLAGIGLLGALLVPLVPALDAGPTATGAAFAAIVFAGAAAIAVGRRWEILLGACAVALAVEIELLGLGAVDGDRGAASVVVYAGLLLLASGIGWGLRSSEDEQPPRQLALSLVLGAGGLVIMALLPLELGERTEGAVLLAFAAAAALACVLLLGRARLLALACAASALAVSGVATADLLSDASLTVVWAAQAAALAWVGGRAREVRVQLAALVYLALATGHAIAFERAIEAIFLDEQHLVFVPGLVAIAVAAMIVARGPLAALAALGVVFTIPAQRVREAFLGIAALAGLAAISLLLVEASFPEGHLAVTVVWSLAGLAVVGLAARREDGALGFVGFGWLAVVLFKALLFDISEFDDPVATAALASVSVALLLAGVGVRWLSRTEEPVDVVSGVAATIAALGLWLAGAVAADVDVLGVGYDRPVALGWLLASGVLYLVLADACIGRERLRNVATALWLLGLPFVLAFEAVLVGGEVVVAWFAATAVAVVFVGRREHEERLVWTGAGLLAATTVATLLEVASLDRFLVASAHPGGNAWAPLACAVAAAAIAWTWPAMRRWLALASAALGLYSLSLVLLELVQAVSNASVETDFQRGHTAVTAVWALIGLGLLAVGLTRRSSVIRLAGLGLFGVALAKLFLYDLSTLSSVTRAAAFLAVGSLLLVGGFLVQRLAQRPDPSAE